MTMTDTRFVVCEQLPAVSTERAMTPGLTLLYAAAVGVLVLPLYAAHPLVGAITASLGLSAKLVGLVATMSILGYAAGLLLLVPLTDLLEIRRIFFFKQKTAYEI